jgi:ribosome-binding factor A
VTRVEMSADLRSAKVYVSVMGDEKTQRLTMRGLESARGFLQAKIAERVQTRYTPILHFHLDQGVKRSIEASRLLREVLPPLPDPPEADDSLDQPDALGTLEENPDAGEELSEDSLFEERCAGPVRPGLPITNSPPFERHTENQDG